MVCGYAMYSWACIYIFMAGKIIGFLGSMSPKSLRSTLEISVHDQGFRTGGKKKRYWTIDNNAPFGLLDLHPFLGKRENLAVYEIGKNKGPGK